MKAIFHALLCVLLICMICSGCTENFEIRCTPVEVAHIADRETFDIFGVFHRGERWFVKYERTFSDGTTAETWQRVTEKTYCAAVESLRE